ncbi:Cys-tRNA(Pro) deacylase [Shewanella psychrotolerans]|uniref:Cys-tRNA(Pro) deacylase n=1 Tax=Shewanella psychrotolerans TaxID=2864206 RepID=UPI001C65A562|nr:Cys-tRNA(Pro) deacylase [Shewanella psychrotolerans]QYK01440.1 Cys-tRNA(Pro) deacylase [Shewanella psychrotolerans]
MTPATKALDKAKINYTVHEYQHQAGSGAYGLEAAEKLNLDVACVFKTLVAEVDNHKLVVAIIPVDKKLNMKCLAKAVGSKKAAMASPEKVQRSTGYVLGGVSPLGQKKTLETFIDTSAQQLAQMYISGGRRGLDIQLSPQDLQALTHATMVDLT